MSHSRTAARQEQIVQLLVEQQIVRVSALADLLAVSSWTVRRDLQEMEEQGLVERSYGQVRLLPAARRLSQMVNTEIQRAVDPHLEAKKCIGRAAARLLRGTQRVALGAGSTTTQVAHALRGEPCCLKVMTNALNIAMILSGDPEMEVFCTGGTVHGSYYSLTGPVAERALREHFFDIAVVGASGVTLAEGLTLNSQLNAFTMQLMIAQARYTMVVTDLSKIGRVRFAHLAPLCAARWLVLDKRPADSFCRDLEMCGVELVIASELVL
jgi:DeoR/GlpR family transcriptional regulator of sugar metabolism